MIPTLGMLNHSVATGLTLLHNSFYLLVDGNTEDMKLRSYITWLKKIMVEHHTAIIVNSKLNLLSIREDFKRLKEEIVSVFE